MEGAIVIDTPSGIEVFQLLRLKGALRLEMKGLKNSRGSVYAYIKRTYGLRGNKQKVYDAFVKLCEEKTGVKDLGIGVLRAR
jgi:hypothetical protein